MYRLSICGKTKGGNEKNDAVEPQQCDLEKGATFAKVRYLDDRKTSHNKITQQRMTKLKARIPKKIWKLSNLPHEIVEGLFSFFAVKELVLVGMVSKSLRDDTQNSQCWKSLYIRDFGVFHDSEGRNKQHHTSFHRTQTKDRDPQGTAQSYRDQYASHFRDYMQRANARLEKRREAREKYELELVQYRARKLVNTFAVTGTLVMVAIAPITFVSLVHRKVNSNGMSMFVVLTPIISLEIWIATVLMIECLLYKLRDKSTSVLYGMWGSTKPRIVQGVMDTFGIEFVSAVLFSITIFIYVISYTILLGAKVDCESEHDCVSWGAVHVPIYLAIVETAVIITVLWAKRAERRWGVLVYYFAVLLFFTCFVTLLVLYLDGLVNMTLYVALTPVWIFDTVALILPLGLVLWNRYKDLEKTEEFLISFILMLIQMTPILTSQFFLCEWELQRYQEHGKPPDDVFIPLFVWFGFFALIMLLLALDQQRAEERPSEPKIASSTRSIASTESSRHGEVDEIPSPETMIWNSRARRQVDLAQQRHAERVRLEAGEFRQLQRRGEFQSIRRSSEFDGIRQVTSDHTVSVSPSNRPENDGDGDSEPSAGGTSTLPTATESDYSEIRHALEQGAQEWGMSYEELLQANLSFQFVNQSNNEEEEKNDVPIVVEVDSPADDDDDMSSEHQIVLS